MLFMAVCLNFLKNIFFYIITETHQADTTAFVSFKLV